MLRLLFPSELRPYRYKEKSSWPGVLVVPCCQKQNTVLSLCLGFGNWTRSTGWRARPSGYMSRGLIPSTSACWEVEAGNKGREGPWQHYVSSPDTPMPGLYLCDPRRGKFPSVLQKKEAFARTCKRNVHQQRSGNFKKKQKLRGLISANDCRTQMLTYSQ